jgi:hypothetical protein
MIAQWLYVAGLIVPPAVAVVGILMLFIPASREGAPAAHTTHAPVHP